LYEITYTDENGNNLTSSNEKVKDYRYIGAVPNNYVEFNNDMYRIIGIFDDNTHGVTGKYLVKLIAVNPLTATTYGSYNTSNTSGVYGGASNDWAGTEYTTKTNANILLNEYFYNRTNTSNTYGSCSNWTYYYSSGGYKTNSCSKIVGYGIAEDLRDYIETVTWHLNGYSGSIISSNNMYLCERGLYTGCTSSNNGGGASTISDKIGLMYVSDYSYARSNYSASSEASGGTSGAKNWLFNGMETFITPISTNVNSNYVVYINSQLFVDGKSYRGMNIRPTFYLKSNVKITKGDGSVTNPYKLGL